jgi:hypothetical protein
MSVEKNSIQEALLPEKDNSATDKDDKGYKSQYQAVDPYVPQKFI